MSNLVKTALLGAAILAGVALPRAGHAQDMQDLSAPIAALEAQGMAMGADFMNLWRSVPCEERVAGMLAMDRD